MGRLIKKVEIKKEIVKIPWNEKKWNKTRIEKVVCNRKFWEKIIGKPNRKFDEILTDLFGVRNLERVFLKRKLAMKKNPPTFCVSLVRWQNNFTRKHSHTCLDQIRFHEAIQINNSRSLKKHNLHHLTHFEQHKTYPFFGWLPCCQGPTPTNWWVSPPVGCQLGPDLLFWSPANGLPGRSPRKPLGSSPTFSSWNGGVSLFFGEDGTRLEDFRLILVGQFF